MFRKLKEKLAQFKRFRSDVPYALAIPPHGLDFSSLTPKQAKENFDWHMEQFPLRVEYLRQRVAADLRIPVEWLDHSVESLRLIWKWFIRTAQLVETPPEQLKQMEKGAAVFGESFINRETFSVETEFILRDIAMYVGDMYVRNYPQLYWGYSTLPKGDVDRHYPYVNGFRIEWNGFVSPAWFQPFRMVGVQAAKLLDRTASADDLCRVYQKWEGWIP